MQESQQRLKVLVDHVCHRILIDLGLFETTYFLDIVDSYPRQRVENPRLLNENPQPDQDILDDQPRDHKNKEHGVLEFLCLFESILLMIFLFIL